MESTSDYWKPVFFLLEREGFDCLLYQASQVKALPGRPKTDKLDSAWLARITEQGSLAGSFVPPEEIQRLRTHTRYRRRLIQARTAEKERCEKLLEDALLTELPGGRFVSCGEFAERVVSVPAWAKQRICRGICRCWGAVSRVAGEDGGSVRAVSAGGRRGRGGRCGRRVSA